VGVLVQCNYGNDQQLRIAGIPVAREMKYQLYCVEKQLNPPTLDWYTGKAAPVCDPKQVVRADGARREQGSIIVIVATDAPLMPDQLKRLARRVSLGLGRAGSIEGDDSGDIFLAFSTANTGADNGNSMEGTNYVLPFKNATVQRVVSWQMDPIFDAVTQSTEEAIDNALIAAKTMTGANYWVSPALPQDQLKEILRKHNMLKQ